MPQHCYVAQLFARCGSFSAHPNLAQRRLPSGYSHRGNAGEEWIGLFNAALFGLLACFLLRRTGNLWMPIGLHMAFDWGETYLYGVPIVVKCFLVIF